MFKTTHSVDVSSVLPPASLVLAEWTCRPVAVVSVVETIYGFQPHGLPVFLAAPVHATAEGSVISNSSQFWVLNLALHLAISLLAEALQWIPPLWGMGSSNFRS